ncbi:hypothetical protein [Actinoplanes sp. HUAS TT8]|uniref:hypothetical protein n=1 Tax=Actinoplanes sp. HUAS TT8 TaxID=3447453 RepID=UPI003F5222F5
MSVVRAELTKIVTLRSVWLVSALIVALHVLIQAANLRLTTDAVTAITPDGTIEIFAGQPRPAARALIDFLVAGSFQMALFLPILAAVIGGQEFRGHQLGQSVLAVPGRTRLTLAKIAATSVVLLLLGAVIAGVSTAFMYLAVRHWDAGLLVSPEAGHGQAKLLLFITLTGLTGLGLALLTRGTLLGLTITLALTALTMSQLLPGGLDALLPLSAGRNLLLDPAEGGLTAGPGHALLVLLAWPAATLTAAGLALTRRDAR